MITHHFQLDFQLSAMYFVTDTAEDQHVNKTVHVLTIDNYDNR